MFKGVSGKMMWGMGALVLMSVGLGVALFTRVTGVLLMFVGFAAGYMWYRKYAPKKPVIHPAPPAVAPPAPLSDAEAARLYREEHKK